MAKVRNVQSLRWATILCAIAILTLFLWPPDYLANTDVYGSMQADFASITPYTGAKTYTDGNKFPYRPGSLIGNYPRATSLYRNDTLATTTTVDSLTAHYVPQIGNAGFAFQTRISGYDYVSDRYSKRSPRGHIYSCDFVILHNSDSEKMNVVLDCKRSSKISPEGLIYDD